MRKTMTTATACLALLCTIPQGFCFDPSGIAKELVQKAMASDPNALLERIAQLEQEISNSENPIADGRAFLRALTCEINAQIGTSYTVRDLCDMIRNNLEVFQFPEEVKPEILDALALLEVDEAPQNIHVENEWNFFKKSRKSKKAECSPGEIVIIALIIAGSVGITVICPASAPAALAAIGGAATALLSKPHPKQ